MIKRSWYNMWKLLSNFAAELCNYHKQTKLFNKKEQEATHQLLRRKKNNNLRRKKKKKEKQNPWKHPIMISNLQYNRLLSKFSCFSFSFFFFERKLLFSIFFPFSLTLFLATPSLGVCSASLIIGVSRTEVSGTVEVFGPSNLLNGPWGAQGGSPKFMMHTKEDKFFTQIATFLFS